MNQVNMNKDNKEVGSFAASILLSQNLWNKKKFINDLKTDWNIEVADSDKDDVLVATIDDMKLAVALMSAPVPDGEAEYYASENYMWEGAVDAAKSHEAHILIAVIGKDADLLERGKLFTKAVSSCLKQEHAIAVYTNETVFQPQFYIEVASYMRQDEKELPILDWIWFGIYRTDKYAGIYTYGMRKFGKEEIEVYADADLNDIRAFLVGIVSYILECDVTMQDGDTIGFSEEQKLGITLSDGIALEGKSLKIEYPQ